MIERILIKFKTSRLCKESKDLVESKDDVKVTGFAGSVTMILYNICFL